MFPHYQPAIGSDALHRQSRSLSKRRGRFTRISSIARAGVWPGRPVMADETAFAHPGLFGQSRYDGSQVSFRRSMLQLIETVCLVLQ